MAKTDQAKTEAPAKDEAKPKRKQLTPAERVAKLEADLAAARQKAEAKESKARNEKIEKRAKLVEKRNALNVQITQLDREIGDQVEATETDES